MGTLSIWHWLIVLVIVAVVVPVVVVGVIAHRQGVCRAGGQLTRGPVRCPSPRFDGRAAGRRSI